ncbi:sigma-54-dependent Fis family transcriptional regulator [bacterium]|nr:sigma-54-dependent Fis family transcriptional regulator [bacterium]
MNRIVLVIDDEESILQSMKFMLGNSGYTVMTAADATAGLKIIKELEHELSVIVTDLFLPGGFDGFDIIEAVKDLETQIPIIMITAFGNVETAVRAMQNGAYTFLTKPIDMKVLLEQMNKAIEVGNLMKENVRLKKENLDISADKYRIIFQSEAMEKLLKNATEIAKTDETVLITGESGTGKELVAHFVLRESRRVGAPFVAFNAAAVTESLMESELFGYKKGAFTGADKNSPGLVGAAEGGTLFIDEIGDMPPSLQTKLLRFLESKEYLPVGSSTPLHANVRIIAATNKNLEKEAEKGNFRKDLYYRLSTFILHIPPLRERKEDIPLLVKHFVEKASLEFAKEVVYPDHETIKELVKQEWKGNVRELKSYMSRFVLTGSGLPSGENGHHAAQSENSGAAVLSFRVGEKTLDEIEKEMLEATLKFTNGDKHLASKLLGRSERTLYRRLSKDDEL